MSLKPLTRLVMFDSISLLLKNKSSALRSLQTSYCIQRHISRSAALLYPPKPWVFEEKFPKTKGTRQPVKKGERYEPVDVKTSIKYMKSKAFAETYGDLPIWHESLYRRNFTGHFPPVLTRPSCIFDGAYIGNHPCPMCRDNHLVLHHDNIALLHHFIEPQTGELISVRKSSICRRQDRRLQIAVARARDRGLLEMRIPDRDYDYRDFYDPALLEEVGYTDLLTPAEIQFLAKSRDVADRQLGRNDVTLDDEFDPDDQLDLVDLDERD